MTVTIDSQLQLEIQVPVWFCWLNDAHPTACRRHTSLQPKPSNRYFAVTTTTILYSFDRLYLSGMAKIYSEQSFMTYTNITHAYTSVT